MLGLLFWTASFLSILMGYSFKCNLSIYFWHCTTVISVLFVIMSTSFIIIWHFIFSSKHISFSFLSIIVSCYNVLLFYLNIFLYHFFLFPLPLLLPPSHACYHFPPFLLAFSDLLLSLIPSCHSIALLFWLSPSPFHIYFLSILPHLDLSPPPYLPLFSLCLILSLPLSSLFLPTTPSPSPFAFPLPPIVNF